LLQKVCLAAAILFLLFLAGSVVGETSVAVNLKSALLVLGGSMLSVLLAFPIKTIRDLCHSLTELFHYNENERLSLVQHMERIARLARLHGARVLENEGNKTANQFLRKGLELIADGYDRYEIRNIMEKEFELYFARRESQISILKTLAKLAPVFGFVGTIMGLINILGHLGEPTEIGKGMALALLTSFYGLLFANFLFMPLGKKLAEYVKGEATTLTLILEGVMDISEQRNSKAMAYRLKSYLHVDGMPRAVPADSANREAPLTARFALRKLLFKE